jgi:tetratricopeptide (TPR) repeat protein
MDFKEFYERGIYFFRNGNFLEAIEEFNKALQLNENYGKIYFNRGLCYTMLEQYSNALLDFTKVIELDENFAIAYLNRGANYVGLEQYSNALLDFTKAIELDENFAIAYIKRGDSYYKMKAYSNAILDYTKVIDLNKYVKKTYFYRGICYLELQQYSNALFDNTKAIDLDDTYADAYINRGCSYNGLKQYSNAILDFSKAIELDENLVEAYNNRGKSFQYLRLYSNAILDFSKAIELDENFAIAYLNRGATYVGLEQYSNALLDFTKAIELDENYASSYYGRGYVYYILGKIQKSHNDICAFILIIISKSENLNKINNILVSFENYPENVQYILDHFDIDTDLLLFNPFDTITRKNNDVNLVLNLIKKSSWFSIEDTRRIEAIFRYHMGGCLTTYEMLDNFDRLISNQELYYWLLSSSEIQVNFREDFSSGIEDMLKNQQTIIDNYYIGLTYLLNEETETASKFFKNSSKFLFSKILIIYLTENKEEKSKLISQLNQEIREFEFDNIDLNKKMSFDAYFHYFECKDYIEELKTFDSLKFETDFTTFQSIFKLNNFTKGQLDILSYSFDIKKALDIMYEEFDQKFNPAINNEEIKNRLDKTKEKFKDIFEKIERNVNEGKDAENELRTIIESYSVNSIKFYSLLITYYYSLNKIEKEQAFYLTLFLVKMSSDNKDKRFDDSLIETYKTGLDTAKTITGNLALKIVFGLAKSGAPKLFEYLQEEDAFDKSGSQYYPFKKNIIDYFKTEKANLSSKQYDEKFKLINYFVDVNGI